MSNTTVLEKVAKHLVLGLTRLGDGSRIHAGVIGIAARLKFNPFMIFLRNISVFELEGSLNACQAK